MQIPPKGQTMDRTLSTGASLPSATSNPTASTAQTAHQAVDDFAERATSQVGRLSGAAHRAVDSTAAAATTATEWASSLPEQAKQAQTRMTEAACESIRARPITYVAGALVTGYLLGRLARF
jgi:hypothetical protein